MQHDLSIITPVFNGIRFIESCIINVIEQKCPNLEHIIVDGGSTDGTVEIITSYAERYEHIKWVSEKDHGQSDAMNKGIAKALGSILGFLNVDDMKCLKSCPSRLFSSGIVMYGITAVLYGL